MSDDPTTDGGRTSTDDRSTAEGRATSTEGNGDPPSDTARRAAIRGRYGAIAAGSQSDDAADAGGSCCGTTTDTDDGEPTSGCCGTDDGDGTSASAHDALGSELGYTAAELDAVAEGANLGLGCGNPIAIAELNDGETVLDLGSGGGFDCFLAAEKVGPAGHVIGVDMTPAMVERARENVGKNEADTVEFRLGEIEHLPVADGTVDVVISNCVDNLSPNKPRALAEVFRVLRPGGRVAISDVVLTAEPPAEVRDDLDLVAGCVGGAATIDEFEAMLDEAGFVDVSVSPNDESEAFIREWDAARDLSDFLTSAAVRARKPAV